jgi:membrane protein required for colicin V production
VHPFDIIAAGFCLLFIILGLFRGFVEEVLRLVAVVVAFLAGLAYYKPLAARALFLHLPGSVTSVLSFFALFLACLVVLLLAGKLIKKVVHLTMLGPVDSICGGVLGFVKAFFLVWIAVICVSSLPFAGPKRWIAPSRTFVFFSTVSPKLGRAGLSPAAGPLQNIMKANPLPALEKALKSADSTVLHHDTAHAGRHLKTTGK